MTDFDRLINLFVLLMHFCLFYNLWEFIISIQKTPPGNNPLYSDLHASQIKKNTFKWLDYFIWAISICPQRCGWHVSSSWEQHYFQRNQTTNFTGPLCQVFTPIGHWKWRFTRSEQLHKQSLQETLPNQFRCRQNAIIQTLQEPTVIFHKNCRQSENVFISIFGQWHAPLNPLSPVWFRHSPVITTTRISLLTRTW